MTLLSPLEHPLLLRLVTTASLRSITTAGVGDEVATKAVIEEDTGAGAEVVPEESFVVAVDAVAGSSGASEAVTVALLVASHHKVDAQHACK
jgi:hypothetical protein